MPPGPFVTLLLLGFAIGGIGHIYKWRPAIALGAVLIFTATVVLPVVILISG